MLGDSSSNAGVADVMPNTVIHRACITGANKAMLPGVQVQPGSISLELALPAVRDGLIVIIASTYGTSPAIQRKVAIVVDIPASKHRTAHLPEPHHGICSPVNRQTRLSRIAFMTASNFSSLCQRGLVVWQVLQSCKRLHSACERQAAGILQFACANNRVLS